MLYPQRMAKVRVIGAKSVIEKTISLMHKMKVIDIIDHKKAEIDIGAPLARADAISEILIGIRALISHLKIGKKETDTNQYEKFVKNEKLNTLSRIKVSLEELNKDAIEAEKQIGLLNDEISKTNAEIENLRLISGLQLNLQDYSGYESLAVFVGAVKDANLHIDKITSRYKLYSCEYEKKPVIALFVEKKKKEEIQQLLSSNRFAEINLSSFQGLKGKPADFIGKLSEKVSRLTSEKSKKLKHIERIKERWSNFLLVEEKRLSNDLEKAEAPLRFASTENVFALEGFLPENGYDEFKRRIEKTTNGKAYVTREAIKEKDIIPVKLNNLKRSEPFEFFMELYSLPKYKEIDPTFFCFLTFPIFFGFMLGDMGYGLTTLLLFMFLKRKVKGPVMAKLINIMIVSSLSTIFFGALFGEFFGEEQILGYHLQHILARAEQINELLYISIAIGVIHLNIGLIIGFFNEKRHHGLAKAINAKLGWIVLQLGVALIALGYLRHFPMYYGYIVIAISLVMLFKGEGIKGLIELPSIFSNMLSYARLMALGIAGVSLAAVVNDIAKEFFHGNILMWLAGILILVTGHTINLGLGLLGPFLHSLRLHYVEFFSKFFEGGGKRYLPFGTKIE